MFSIYSNFYPEGRARKKMDELERLLEIAKSNYTQLGGRLSEDRRRIREDRDSKRCVRITWYVTCLLYSLKFIDSERGQWQRVYDLFHYKGGFSWRSLSLGAQIALTAAAIVTAVAFACEALCSIAVALRIEVFPKNTTPRRFYVRHITSDYYEF